MATMRERSPGVWELRVYTGRDPVSGNPRQVSRTFRGGKRAANTALAQLVVDHQEGELQGSNGTVAQLLDEWLRTGTPDISNVTRATYVRTADLLKAALGSVKLTKMGSHDIENAYQRMAEAGTSAYVLRQCHVSLRSALSTAVRWQWIKSNPARDVKAPKTPKAEPWSPTVKQVSALIRELEKTDPDLSAMVTVAALTGLRRGELCGLRWSDLEDGELRVQRAWVVADGKVELSLPKMEKKATLVLSEPVAEALVRVWWAQESRARKLGIVLEDDGWILSFDGLGGQPRKPDHVGRAIVAASTAAGRAIRPHELRHFAATTLLANGVDIRTAASQLRHDPRVLLDHYAAQDPIRRQEAADILGRALTQ